jgi:DNA (cytosine-5)-methyltransferase 1
MVEAVKFAPLEVDYIVIDLFSGAGGTSTGIERATVQGDKIAVVIAAVNHDPVAIESHALNHPYAVHFVEDVRNIAFWQLKALVQLNRSIYPNARLVIWASAECTNYSKAKGGRPRDADSRTLPEALYQYVEYFRPDILQVENVVEFMAWGGLDQSGRPVSRLAGTDYLRWCERLRGYGYEYAYRVLNAADFGGYTSRVRYFGQFVREGQSFVWPEATHCKNGSKNIFSELRKWNAVREVLDLTDEGESIFIRKKPLCEKTLERIYAGLLKFVACPDKAFITKYYSGEPEHKNISLDAPAGSFTTIDSQAVVFLQQYHGKGTTISIESPATVLTTKDRLAIVQSQFLDQQYGTGKPASIDRPSGTLTQIPKLSLVSTKWLMDTSYGNKGTGIDEPSPTLLACRKHHYLINAKENHGNVIVVYPQDSPWTVKIKMFCYEHGIIDIRMRMLRITEMLRIMGFGDQYKLSGTQTDKKKFIGNAVHTLVPQRWYEAMGVNNRSKRQAV